MILEFAVKSLVNSSARHYLALGSSSSVWVLFDSQLLLLFPWARDFTHIAPVYPVVGLLIGNLVFAREAKRSCVQALCVQLS